MPAVPKENEKLKRLTRRRRQLVGEKVRVMKRMQADLQAVCSELLGLSRKVDNLWFLRFLSCRDGLEELARLTLEEIREIPGIGAKYAGIIRGWQRRAEFSPEVEYVGPMIVADARRILELLSEMAALEEAIEELCEESELARRLRSIPGFGTISAAELAGEIGTLDRFGSEASLALYLGMCPLDKQSGQLHGTRSPRQVNKRAKAAMMVAVAHHIWEVPELGPTTRRSGRKGNGTTRR